MTFTASYELTGTQASEIDRYVRDELGGQYALLGRFEGTNRAKMMHGRKGRPRRGWAVRAIMAALPSRS